MLIAPSSSHCCANCFAHPWLKHFIRDGGDEKGTCSYCQAHHVRMLNIEALAEPFNNLLGEYVGESYREHEIEPGSHHWRARPLLEALQEDWELFAPVTLARNTVASLLSAILNHSVHKFGDQLKHDSWVLNHSTQAMFTASRQFNKFFGCDPFSDRISFEEVRKSVELLGTAENQVADNLPYFAVLLETGRAFVRARQGCEKDAVGTNKPYDDLGPNPLHPASRANTDSQYALYLADAATTALAEIRLLPGDVASVAEVSLTQNVTVLDLSQSFGEINPFVTKNLSWILDLSHLLSSVAEVISRPAFNPSDYALTQHMANIARAAGYDGIRYPSALDGRQNNLVLFTSGVVRIGNTWVATQVEPNS